MKPPTDKQLRYLASLGYSGVAPKSRREASSIIDGVKLGRVRRRKAEVGEWRLSGSGHTTASPRQIQLLRRLGYEGPEDISSVEARRLHSYLRQTRSPG